MGSMSLGKIGASDGEIRSSIFTDALMAPSRTRFATTRRGRPDPDPAQPTAPEREPICIPK
jgi:hypothetical protein